MNTLSAKADSFLEHVAYWRRYAPLARSRPGSLENIPSSVFVPIERQATPASVDAHAQGLGNLGAARGAELACIVRGHLNYFTTSLGNFVRPVLRRSSTKLRRKSLWQVYRSCPSPGRSSFRQQSCRSEKSDHWKLCVGANVGSSPPEHVSWPPGAWPSCGFCRLSFSWIRTVAHAEARATLL